MPSRNKDDMWARSVRWTAVDRTRLMTRVLGVKKTYKLTYESSEVMYAVFDKTVSKNHWSIGTHVLKSFGEYFGPKTEQLDIYYEGGRVTFTSYTEKIANGNGMSVLYDAVQSD